MALPIFAGVATAVPIMTSKKAENKRKQAAANTYSAKYPLLDNCAAMEASIQNAVTESKNIDASPAETAGAKRIKKRVSNAIRSWLLVMREHLKDLQCGINVASTVQPMIASENVMRSAVEPEMKREVIANTVMANVQPDTNNGNIASPTREKGVNWVLIGGVVVGGFLLLKYLKK
jgi:hypothetical protein